MDRDRVSLHADVVTEDTPPRAPYLFQVVPLRFIAGQEAYPFHNLDLFLAVTVIRAGLWIETIT